ncbi:MAG TPA: hypothetical protein VFJ18_14480 [Pararhizobium sp.]|nr:hypothetical protein [Pararhizobium sp.]
MVKGSGLFVGTTGHVAYHHFNPLHDFDNFFYEAGEYQIEVWAQVFGCPPAMLGKYEFSLDNSPDAIALSHHEAGIIWNWSPSDHIYYPELSTHPFYCHPSIHQGQHYSHLGTWDDFCEL